MADNIFLCVFGKLDGKLSDERLEALVREYAKLRSTYPTESPERIAAFLEAIVLNHRSRRASLGASQVIATSRIIDYLARFPTAEEKAEALESILSRDNTGKYRFSHNFEDLRSLYTNQMDALAADAMVKLTPRRLGVVQDKAMSDEVLNALLGDTSVSDNAKAVAGGMREAFDYVKDEMRRLGVNVGELENFVPAKHNPALVGNVDFETWRAKVRQYATFDHVKGDDGEPVSPEELDEILQRAYDKIVTEGATDFDVFRPQSYATFTSRLEKQRLFRWKDGASWKAYQEEFGFGGNLMETFVAYRNATARDLAIMHSVGTDPAQTMAWMKSRLTQSLGDSEAQTVVRRLENQWDIVSGNAAIPTSELGGWAARVQDILKILTRVSTLGGAGFASTTDLIYADGARQMYGLSRKMLVPEFFRDVTRQVTRSGAADAEFTRRLKSGLGANAFVTGLVNSQRASGDFVTSKFLHRMQDSFFKINGLHAITEGVKNVQHVAALVGLRKAAAGGLDSVPGPMREALEGYGVTDDLLRQLDSGDFDVEFDEGMGLNIPKVMRELGRDAAAPLTAMVNDIKVMSSPMPSIKVRAYLNGGNRPGELKSLLWDSFTMFWSFPISAVQTQLLRRMYASMSRSSRATQLTYVMVAGALAGAFIVQGRNMAAGKEPMEWDESELWLQAAMMSGVLGLAGDYAVQVAQGSFRYSTIAGPMAQPVVGAADTLAALVDQAVGGDASIGAPLERTTSSLLPGRNLPVVGVALNRILLDNIREITDPRAHRAFTAEQRRVYNRTGQKFWWRPGENLPEALK